MGDETEMQGRRFGEEMKMGEKKGRPPLIPEPVLSEVEVVAEATEYKAKAVNSQFVNV